MVGSGVTWAALRGRMIAVYRRGSGRRRADGRASEDEVQVSQVLRVEGSSGVVTILDA